MHDSKCTALGISVISIIFNSSLTLLKIIVGIFGNSYALVYDGIHSFADVLASMIVAVGIRMAAKPADEKHPLGHEKMECVTAIAVSIILCFTGVLLGYKSIVAIAAQNYGDVEAPTTLAVIMAVVPIVLKEIMCRFEMKYGTRLSSDALRADASHHRADALVSLGVLFGVAGGHFGYPVIDKIAGFIVALLIIKTAAEIFYEAVCKLIDKAAPKELYGLFNSFVSDKFEQNNPCMNFESTLRMFGGKYIAEITMHVDGSLPVKTYLDFSNYLEKEILDNFPEIKCCNIFFKPL